MPKLLITEDRKIHFVLLPLVAGVLLVLPGVARAQNCTDDGSGPYGSLLDHREFNQAVQALPPAAFLTPRVQPPLPSHAYLYNLPAVSEQGTPASPGSPGSCEAQSFGYGLGSYTAARRPDGSLKWVAALAEKSVSAAYLFAWGNFSGFAHCGNAFLPGTWTVSLQGTDMSGKAVSYTGSIMVGQAEPNALPGASMAGQTITDSTGAVAEFSL